MSEVILSDMVFILVTLLALFTGMLVGSVLTYSYTEGTWTTLRENVKSLYETILKKIAQKLKAPF